MMKTKLLSLTLCLLAPFFVRAANVEMGKFNKDVNTVIREPRQLTFVGPRSGEGYFSKDGQKMIFQSEREPGNPFYQMYLLDLVKGTTQRLSPGPGKTTCGWIHPSGNKVMWSSTHLDSELKKKTAEEYESRKKPVKGRYSWSYDDSFDIFESDLRGKKIKRLTREKGYDAEGSYSPDGQWIAFASNRAAYSEKLSEDDAKLFEKDPSYLMDIYIMKADGTKVRRLTTAKGYDGGPFFSPNGKRITWRRFSANGATAEVFTMNVDGTDEKQITRLGAMSWAPYYHSSGDYLIFGTSVLGYSNFELFIVDKDGAQDPVRVTFDEGFDGLATFTPDGSKISWTRRNEKGESQILLADWDDSQARRLLKLPARDPGPQGLAKEIREEDLRRWVEWMASEAMNGRQAGSAEEKILTAKYAEAFRSWGLVGGAPDGSFFHRFEYTSAVRRGKNNTMQLVGSKEKSIKIGEEAQPFSFSSNVETPEAPMIFAGYGIRAPANEKEPAYDSFQDLDVRGKWVLALRDLPEDVSPTRKHYLSTYSRLQHKVTVAREAGAIGLVIIEGLTALKETSATALRFEGSLSASSLPAWRVGGPWVEELFQQSKQNYVGVLKALNQGEMVSFPVPSIYLKAQADLISEKSTGINVIAKLPSKRKNAKAVLIGAHGDHLGRGESGSSLARGTELGGTHFGADDNASGVAAVLELAHVFSQSRKSPLADDLLFAIWSAEEIGVLGSNAFVRDWAKIKRKPLKDTVSASLNMDMVGRLRDRLQVQGMASGDNWKRLAEEVSFRTGVSFSLTDDPYLPTDALSFYMAGLPSISFFTGSHSEYHTPKDTADTLNYAGLARVTATVGEFAKQLAASSISLVKYQQVKGNAASKLEGRSFRIYLGTIPDYSQEGSKGVRISGVSKDSPAAMAGLKEKDVIVEFNGTKIENIYDYVYTLQAAKANEETVIKVRRGDSVEDLKITPKLKE
jgi:Tol biopolymer transport system component